VLTAAEVNKNDLNDVCSVAIAALRSPGTPANIAVAISHAAGQHPR
jgi:hypothetical protein